MMLVIGQNSGVIKEDDQKPSMTCIASYSRPEVVNNFIHTIVFDQSTPSYPSLPLSLQSGTASYPSLPPSMQAHLPTPLSLPPSSQAHLPTPPSNSPSSQAHLSTRLSLHAQQGSLYHNCVVYFVRKRGGRGGISVEWGN